MVRKEHDPGKNVMDGRLEVVVDVQKWDGFGARVFQIDGDDVIQTLSAEC